MRSILLVSALLLSSCSTQPAKLADVTEMIAANNWDGAEAAVAKMIRQNEGCDLGKAHALAAGIQKTRVILALTEPIPEREDAVKSTFMVAYGDAKSLANEHGPCNLRPLNPVELGIGG